MKIISIVGARPNFVKIAPLAKELKKYKNIEHIIIHTGQHYDYEMSKQFFEDLYIPTPQINLEVGSGLHGEQTAKVIEKLEKIFIEIKPDLVLVVGDVNSTMAASIAASKLSIKVAHIEAGLRSYDRTMPEEINRIITDHLANYLFTTFESANKILEKEGIDSENIHFVGNVMIDSLIMNMDKIDKSNILKELSLNPKDYVVVTLHRPKNVDSEETLRSLLDILNEIQKQVKLVFPIHPRTITNIEKFNLKPLLDSMKNIQILKPMSYTNFLCLVKNAKFVLTDSGGIQEETTYLNVPCITVRENTERPETIFFGTNFLTGNDKDKILSVVYDIIHGKVKKGLVPPKWDGKASERIIKVLLNEPAE